MTFSSWDWLWWAALLVPAILNWLSVVRARRARWIYENALHNLQGILAQMPQYQCHAPWEQKPHPSGTLAREYPPPPLDRQAIADGRD